MNPEAEGSLKSIRESSHFSQNNQEELSLQLLNTTHEFPNEHDFLSEQFSRCSYKVYKFWLVLTFLIALVVEFYSINYLFWIFTGILHYPTLEIFALATTSKIIAFFFLILGCSQIFFAIAKKRSSIAQKSALKFQYSMIAVIFGLFFTTQAPGFKVGAVTTAWPLLIASHLAISSAVLRVFKKNNPLARRKDISKNADDTMITYSLESDFLEQNEAISLELWKYDEQLRSWQYLIYKFWLRFAVILEIILFSGGILAQIIKMMKEKDEPNQLTLMSFVHFFFGVFTFGLTAYCSYEMEIVLRIKRLETSKKALLHLKICIFVAIFSFLLSCTRFSLTIESLRGVGENFGSLILAPLLMFFGAFYANKIIEQRDQFVKVSSYNEDSYA